MASSFSSEAGDYHFDLRHKMIFKPKVKNQGRSNSCWAIVAAEVSSALYNLSHERKDHVETSPQELIDYVHMKIQHMKEKEPDETGCLTSSANNGFRYIRKYGICMEQAYEFKAKKQTSISEIPKFVEGVEPPRHLVEDIYPRLWLEKEFVRAGNSDKDILEVLKERPIASAVEFTPEFAKFTGTGIFDGTFTSDEIKQEYERKQKDLKKEGTNPTGNTEPRYHAVMIIGFGRKNGVEYYVIKNSYGEKWGDWGYAKICRDLILLLYTSWPVGASLRTSPKK